MGGELLRVGGPTRTHMNASTSLVVAVGRSIIMPVASPREVVKNAGTRNAGKTRMAVSMPIPVTECSMLGKNVRQARRVVRGKGRRAHVARKRPPPRVAYALRG